MLLFSGLYSPGTQIPLRNKQKHTSANRVPSKRHAGCFYFWWTGYDETCYQLSACIPQQTDIHDFFLSLKREKDNQTINQPSLLYHGIHDIVKIREGKENIVWIDLKQITNHIQVIVHNLNDKKKHIIYIEDNNGKYDSFLQYADDEKITYLLS